MSWSWSVGVGEPREILDSADFVLFDPEATWTVNARHNANARHGGNYSLSSTLSGAAVEAYS